VKKGYHLKNSSPPTDKNQINEDYEEISVLVKYQNKKEAAIGSKGTTTSILNKTTLQEILLLFFAEGKCGEPEEQPHTKGRTMEK
jgi:hypothetical protein